MTLRRTAAAVTLTTAGAIATCEPFLAPANAATGRLVVGATMTSSAYVQSLRSAIGKAHL